MECKKVVAIVRNSVFSKIEDALLKKGIKGLTVWPIMGIGEYANFTHENWLANHMRVEIYAEKDKAEMIAKLIMDTASWKSKGDGLVVILPVEKIYRIRTCTEADPGEI